MSKSKKEKQNPGLGTQVMQSARQPLNLNPTTSKIAGLRINHYILQLSSR
jgi:hypothetical protein